MARLLLVDDNRAYCMRIGLALTAKGHAAEVAASGREAIDVGIGFRPDILVSDWMLEGSIDGIQLSEVLRAVRPETHTILVTGFPSQDVRDTALRARIFGFFEKPVRMEKLYSAIDKALETEAFPADYSVGLVEYDSEYKIVYANAKAGGMLGLPGEITGDRKLADLLSYRSLVSVKNFAGAWIELSLADSLSRTFHGFVKGASATRRFLVLLEENETNIRKSPLMRDLLDSGDESTASQVPGTFLLVDEDKLQRRLASSQLEALGHRFHSAESCERALRILENDEEIKIVLLDFGPPENNIGEIVEKLRSLRPEVAIIGTSTAFRKREFAEAGVDQFLTKPITGAALSELLGSSSAFKATGVPAR